MWIVENLLNLRRFLVKLRIHQIEFALYGRAFIAQTSLPSLEIQSNNKLLATFMIWSNQTNWNWTNSRQIQILRKIERSIEPDYSRSTLPIQKHFVRAINVNHHIPNKESGWTELFGMNRPKNRRKINYLTTGSQWKFRNWKQFSQQNPTGPLGKEFFNPSLEKSTQFHW